MTPNDQLVFDLAERVRHRFFGKYRGTVTQVDGARMRLKAKVPAVLRSQETGWATPCVPYAGKQVGIAFLPEPGAGVWIEFEGGDVSKPIWVGCYWRNGELPPEAGAESKAIVTKTMKLVFDDSAPSCVWSDANQNSLTLDSNGVAVEHGTKNLKVTSSNVSVNDGALEVL